MNKNIFFLLLLTAISFSACKKKGCTDPDAINYNANAKKDNGSCKYNEGLTNERISYGAGERQHFDLSLPADYDENTKTVILIHGGAWVLGPLPEDEVLIFGELGIDLTDRLLDEGYAVAAMKYRLACYSEDPADFTAPAFYYMNQMIEDVDLAIAKLKTEAVSRGFSATNFALIGESAGGHIALMHALRSDDPALKTVISFYAPTEMDDEDFKEFASTPPYTNLAVNSVFALQDMDLACDMRTGGTMNTKWGLSSFAGVELETGTTNPAFTDTISPAHIPNIERNLPVFMMHGLADDLVPNTHADFLMSSLNSKFGTSPAADGDFTGQHKLKKYSSCGHGWSGGGCSKGVIRNDVISWLNVHF